MKTVKPGTIGYQNRFGRYAGTDHRWHRSAYGWAPTAETLDEAIRALGREKRMGERHRERDRQRDVPLTLPKLAWMER